MESNELDNKIQQMVDIITKLNHVIFIDPSNHTRPPSEYLEIYNTLTDQLHNLQVRKENIDVHKLDDSAEIGHDTPKIQKVT